MKTATIEFTKLTIAKKYMQSQNYLFIFCVLCLTACTDRVVFTAPKMPMERQPLDIMIETIQKTPDWIGKLKKEAAEKKLSLDSLVLENAIWMVDEANKKKKAQ